MSAPHQKPGALPEGDESGAHLRDVTDGDPAHENVLMVMQALEERFVLPLINSVPAETRPNMASTMMTAFATYAGCIFGKLVADGDCRINQLDAIAEGTVRNFREGAKISMSVNMERDAEGRA